MAVHLLELPAGGSAGGRQERPEQSTDSCPFPY